MVFIAYFEHFIVWWLVEPIQHCVKSVRFRSYSGLYFPAFRLNTEQNNSEYEHFLRSVSIDKQS